MRVVLERFEGDMAILELEDETVIAVDKRLVEFADEGDIIDITVNKEETKKRKESVEELINRLFE